MRFRAERALALLLCAWPAVAGSSGGWQRVLDSVGLDAWPAISVVQPGAGPWSEDWPRRVERGAFLILEGKSEIAAGFGFRPGPKRLRVRSARDEHSPKLAIIWARELELPVFDVPVGARVFMRERWEGAPLLAGLRKGKGAVLWAAADPGENGYERFPCAIHALRDLGIEPPVQARRLWAFFDSSYRLRADPAYLAARWRESGIAALHVAAWHYFEPGAQRDAYLQDLIRECHRRGVLVYAWLELPHVGEKFWRDHPEWREKTALLQDAHLDWRLLMNLVNRDCQRAVAQGLRTLLGRFDWDGVNLAEIYFESLEGAANPARFTPMNEDVRREFTQVGGFDPAGLFQKAPEPGALRAFLDYRTSLRRRVESEWVDEIEAIRSRRPGLDLVLTQVDDRFDETMRDAIGADAAPVLASLGRRDLTFMVEDPATVWHLGPQRYPEIARRYRPLTREPERLAVDINVVERYQDVYPTKQQTGTELFQLVRLASRSFGRVALYFENSILPPDLPFLPAASAPSVRFVTGGRETRVELERPAGIRWAGPARVDGKPWPATDGERVWLPAGEYTLESGSGDLPMRLLDLNGDLASAAALPDGLEFSYTSNARALAILDRAPVRIEIDGVETKPVLAGPTTLSLPRGRHHVRVSAT